MKGEKKKRRKSVEPLLASRNIFSSGCSSVRSVQPLPENSKRLPSGIIKSAREEWPRNPPGNGKMAITSFYVTRILDHSRPQRFTRFSTPPIFATRFPPFAFNSFSRLRMHKQKRSLTIQQIVDDYTPIDLTYWVCDACLNYTLQKVFFTLILLPRRSMI